MRFIRRPRTPRIEICTGTTTTPGAPAPPACRVDGRRSTRTRRTAARGDLPTPRPRPVLAHRRHPDRGHAQTEHATQMPHLTWCSPNAWDWTMSRAMPDGVGDGPSDHEW